MRATHAHPGRRGFLARPSPPARRVSATGAKRRSCSGIRGNRTGVEPFRLIKEYQFFPDGDYVTGHGSLLQTAMLGFTGLRFSAGDWRRYPAALPEGWDRIEIDRVWVRGEPLRLVAEHGKTAVLTNDKGVPLPLRPAGKAAGAGFSGVFHDAHGSHDLHDLLDIAIYHIGSSHPKRRLLRLFSQGPVRQLAGGRDSLEKPQAILPGGGP